MDLAFYRGEHSVIFDHYHSWNDWHLIPSTPPVIPPPKPRTNYVTIPGTSGQIDASELASGFPLYEPRSGSLQFIYLPEFGSSRKMYEDILNAIHGRRIKVILTDDPDYYYEGRVSVNEYGISKEYSGFTFDYSFNPFKLSTRLEPGFSNIQVDGSKVLHISAGTSPMRINPVVTSDAAFDAVLTDRDGNEKSFTIVAGSYRYPGFILGPGPNTLTLSGNGTITIEVRKGGL